MLAGCYNETENCFKTPVSENIFDISDTDEDDDLVKPAKKVLLSNLQKGALKGWNTCSTGFDNFNQYQQKIKVPTQFISQSPSYVSQDEKNSSFSERHSASKKWFYQQKKNNDSPIAIKHSTIHKIKGQKSMLFEIQNIQSVFQPAEKDYSKYVSYKGATEFESDIFASSLEQTQEETRKKTPQRIRRPKSWRFNDLSNCFRLQAKQGVTDELHDGQTNVPNNATCCEAVSQTVLNQSPDIIISDDSSHAKSQEQANNPPLILLKHPSIETPVIYTQISESPCSGKENSAIQRGSVHKRNRSFGSVKIEDTNRASSNNSVTSSAEIISADSTPDGNPTSTSKGSSWLQSIEWQKEISVKNYSECNEASESLKKFKRFQVGGFAEQAQKLENKERSAKVIWSHKKCRSLQNYLTLRLSTYHVIDGMVMSKCTILNDSTKPVNVKQQGCIKVPSSDICMPDNEAGGTTRNPLAAYHIENKFITSPVVDKLPSENKKTEECIVLFKLAMFDKLLLKIGRTFQLFSPWQTLNIPSVPYPVILCAYFIEVLEPAVKKEVSGNICYKTEEVIFSSSPCDFSERVLHEQSPLNKDFQTVKHEEKISNDFKSMYSLKKSDNELNISSPCRVDKKYLMVKKNESQGSEIFSQSSDESPLYMNRKCTDDSVQDNVNAKVFEAVNLSQPYAIVGNKFSICARIQRIWQWVASNRNAKHKMSMKDSPQTNIRFTLLLQDQQQRFWELQLPNFSSLVQSNLWYDLLHNGEGQCYKFCNVKVSQKLHRAKCPALFTIFESICKKQQKHNKIAFAQQPICYQLTTYCAQSFALSFSEDIHPPYCPLEVQLLDKLQQNEFRRFSCAAKIISVHNKIVYITDKSLQDNTFNCYFKLNFCPLSVRPPMLISGSVILIVDASFQKEMLFVDKYSTVSILSPSPKIHDKVTLTYQNHLVPPVKVEELSSLTFKDFYWGTLTQESRVDDLVEVEGRIISVDEETAISWVQCDFCNSDNLLQDENSIIYCEDCKHVVQKPILNIKMNVFVLLPYLPKAMVTIQLLSSTIKEILKIGDSMIQPKCNVADLDRKLRKFLCCVKTCEALEDDLKFELVEIG